MATSLAFRTIGELSAEMESGLISPAELARLYLDRIAHYNQQLNAFLHVELQENKAPGSLRGIPIAIKDLVDIAGLKTTAASAVLESNVAARDAEVITHLRSAGASFLGKTNLHEFAYGGSGVIGYRGPARNPWNVAHITGGSSSGSAAAVAAGLCAAAVGTDTAGSIRLPASFCGIVGFKPTFGLVSAKGVVPLAVSYDHVGPMTRSVADARRMFEAMLGAAGFSATRQLKKIGIPFKYFFKDLNQEVESALTDAVNTLKRAGYSIVEVDFPVDENRTLASWEPFQYHAKWVAETPELYQPETLRRIRSGAKITDDAARAAKAQLEILRASAANLFTDVDVLLTPTVPILPPAIDDLLGNPETLRHRELLMLRNTRPFNVLGVPAVSIPWKLSAAGLPIGIQLAAAPNCDFELLDFAEKAEALSPWQGRTPPEFS